MRTVSISFDTRTVPGLLDDVAERAPDRLAFRYLHEGVHPEEWTYGELHDHVRRWAAVLASSPPGARTLLLLPSDRDHALAFLASVYAGLVPVPVALPESGRLRRVRERLEHVVADADPELVLSTRSVLSMAGDDPLFDGRETIAMDEPPVGGIGLRTPRQAPDDMAFLQYTSGSTQAPKGVCNTHGSLLRQVEYMIHMQRVAYAEDEMHIVSWLPLYHDMGLIFGLLGPLLAGGTATFMRPGSFAGDPRRWFEAISRYRGNGTCGPDFSYQVCCDAFTDDEIAGLDLSCLRFMGNGAEPIRPETMTRVRERFAPAGLPPTSISAAYGLAEAGLIVSTDAEPREPRIGHYDPGALSAGRAEPVPAGEGRAMVGCGDFFHEWRVAVVDPETREELPGRRTGEIWVNGPGLPDGYWNRPDETAETFEAHLASGEGPFLRTGDAGFLDGGELYVCGRRKDLIIVHGANIHPSDLEMSLERAVDAVRLGGACAVQTDDRLVAICEVDRNSPPHELAATAERVRAVVSGEHGLAADDVVLVRRGALLRTSSGKVRRQATGERYRAGDLPTLHIDSAATRPPLAGDTGPPAQDGATLPLTMETLREAVAGLLDVPPAHVGDDTNLVQAGLDSLMVFRLASRFGYTGAAIEFHELFDQPTLRAWAALASPATDTQSYEEGSL